MIQLNGDDRSHDRSNRPPRVQYLSHAAGGYCPAKRYRRVRTLRLFLVAWVEAWIWAENILRRVGQIVVFLASLIPAFTIHDKITLRHEGQVLQISIGVLISASLVGLAGAIAFGIAWARFRHLRVGPTLRHLDNTFTYYLPVANDGVTDALVVIRLESVRRSDGSRVEPDTQHSNHASPPFELPWLNCEEVPPLSNGFPHYVRLFDYWTNEGDAELGVRSRHGDFFGCRFKPAGVERIWLEVSVGSAGSVYWIWAEAGEVTRKGPLKVMAGIGTPPFVKWPRRA
jgi:hypothetical protein